MSENQDSGEMLLPDDADRKIEELMAALRESEQEMMGSAAAKGGAEEPAAEEAFEPEEEFLSDEESDYVDLDAELLDNSADKLELDESDATVEQLMENEAVGSELPAEESIEAEEPPAAEESLDSSVEEQKALEADELANNRLDELERKLAAVQAAPLRFSAPSYNRNDSFPGWISATLAVLALVLSATALWFSYNTPAPEQSVAAASITDAERELRSLKVDMAALRERLSAVEMQAEQGGEEAVAMLERMRLILARMEKKLTTVTGGGETEVIDLAEGQTAVAIPAPETKSASKAKPVKGGDTAAVKESEPAVIAPKAAQKPAPVATKGGKVFVKGWAVNLRSFYHRLDAERLMQRYQKAGIDAQVREIPKGNTTWYRVRVMGFESKKAAEAFIEGLSTEQGRELAWPSYYQGYIDG